MEFTPEELNTLYPICGITLYPRAIVTHRQSTLDNPFRGRRGVRRSATRLSRRSLFNFLFKVSNAIVEWKSLLTLTYGPNYPLDGRQVKKHLNAFITSMRRQYGDFQYFWFLEFQARGAPHLHVGLDIPNPGKDDRLFVASVWSRLVELEGVTYCSACFGWDTAVFCYGGTTRDAVLRQHRRVKTWENLREKEGAIRYVAKYVGKPTSKRVPRWFSNVGRYWGFSRGVSFGVGYRYSATESNVREIAVILGRNLGEMDVLPKIIMHSGYLP